MPGPVCYISDQMIGSPFGTPQQTVRYLDQYFDQIDILPFVKTADIIGIPDFPFMKNQIDSPCMIFDKQPIPDIFSFSIHRERLIMTNIINKQRNQFFGKLIRTVVIRTIRDLYRQTVSIVISPDKMIRRSFRSRIRRMRIVLGLFGKQFLTGLQSTVHLVGRNMVKQLIVKMALPG